jgi:hypothetical protein
MHSKQRRSLPINKANEAEVEEQTELKEFPMIRNIIPRVSMRRPAITQKEKESPEGCSLVEEIIFP